jgi:hypothetical protein
MKKNWFGKSLLITVIAIGTILTGCSSTQSDSIGDIKTTETVNHDHMELLKQTKQLADQGKVISSEEFGLYTPQEEIEAKWGKPDSDSNLADGEWKYNKHSTTFYLGKNITDSGGKTVVSNIKTTDKRYAAITAEELQKTLKDGVVYKEGGYITYSTDIANLTFYFNLDNSGNLTTIKHVEVTSP